MFRFGSKKELSSKEKDLRCSIRLLEDDEVLECDFTKEHNGQYLLDYCYKNLDLEEKDYFGLRFVDSQKQRNWLDPNRPIYKQVKGLTQIVFCFRVKFYPSDVGQLKEETTRYLLYLQLRRDLQHGRLHCSTDELAYLIACILQSELGDYEPGEHSETYAADMILVREQENLDTALKQAMELHKTEMKEKTPSEVEQLFLKKAFQLDTYGIDPQPVKDHKGTPLFLGVNYLGILTFQGSRKTHFFKWPEVRKVNYEGRMFIVHLVQQSQQKKSYIGFKCSTVASCHYIWRCAVEQRYFFTMSSSSDVPQITTGGGFFFRQTKLHYSGRVQREILESSRESNEKGVQRSQSMMVSNTKGIPRSNTIHLGNNTVGGTLPTGTSTLDDSMVNHRYENTSTRSEPDESRAGSETPAASGQNRFAIRNSTPLRPHSVAVGQSNNFNHSFTTEFDMRPDLTPTEAEHEFLPIDASGSWSPNNAIDKPLLQPSPSRLLPDSNLDKVSEHADDEQNEQLADLQTAHNNRKWPTNASGGIVKQRSDSATRRKLTRQQATTSDQQTNADKVEISNDSNQIKNAPISLRKRVWSVCRATLISTIIFVSLVALTLWIFFEVDNSNLAAWRQMDEAQLVNEQLYRPTRQWIVNTLLNCRSTIDSSIKLINNAYFKQ